MDGSTSRPGQPARLVLIAPPSAGARLVEAMAGGDVAAVILAREDGDEDAYPAFCAAAVPIIQAAGAAALVCGDSRLIGRCGADGVYFTKPEQELALPAVGKAGRPIVGIGGLQSRHAAMTAGERNPDFVLFGRIDGDSHPEPYRKNLELAEWWAALIEIPCVVMAGNEIGSVRPCAATGAEFVAARAAIWQAPAGAGAAVAEANRLLQAAAMASERA